MIDALKDDLDKRFRNVSPKHLQIATAGTFEHPEDAELWRRAVQEAFPEYNVYYTPLSCSIACHVGMDALGIGIAKLKDEAENSVLLLLFLSRIQICSFRPSSQNLPYLRASSAISLRSFLKTVPPSISISSFCQVWKAD